LHWRARRARPSIGVVPSIGRVASIGGALLRRARGRAAVGRALRQGCALPDGRPDEGALDHEGGVHSARLCKCGTLGLHHLAAHLRPASLCQG
jgi:hypothetical protein